MKRLTAIVAVAFALAGCVPEYQVKNLAGTQNTISLSRTEGVYIALPADGAYGSQTYSGSGQTVAQVLAASFSQYAPRVHTGASVTDNVEDFAAATKEGDRYLVIPVITHWEPRNTAWSGLRSRMALQITIFDVASEKPLSSVAIEGASAQQTLSSTSPEQLLDEPVGRYISGLYR